MSGKAPRIDVVRTCGIGSEIDKIDDDKPDRHNRTVPTTSDEYPR